MTLQTTRKEFKVMLDIVHRAMEVNPINSTHYRKARQIRKMLVENFHLNTNEMERFRNEEPKLVAILKLKSK